MPRIGVVALQGGFTPHVEMLRALGLRTRLVRGVEDCAGLDGVVLPGGESSSQRKAFESDTQLRERLNQLHAAGAPVLATCAGLILVAGRVWESADRARRGLFAWLPITVRRNAYGRQLQSRVSRTATGREVLLIRAPQIVHADERVTVLERLEGSAVTVRAGSVVGATHHPELRGDDYLHRLTFH